MKGSEKVLLKGGRIVTMDGARRIVDGDLLINGDRIAAVGAVAKDDASDAQIIDCSGRLVIPGLIQPHTHLCQTLFRGYADDLELLDWLMQRIWPFEAAHDHESLTISATLGAAELLRSGTTAILDMGTVHHTDAIFEAAKAIGLRATIGKAMMDAGQGLPPRLKEKTEDSLAESVALAERWHGQANGRLRYAFAPRFVLSCSDELMKGCVEEARRLGLRLHTHASENAGEIMTVRNRCGVDNIVHLHNLGMSGDDTILAHCVWATSEEQRILRESGTHVAHCPSSNLKLASGLAKIPDLMTAGINVGLAADGAPCNNNLDAFVEMRLAALIHKPRFGPTAMPAQTVFEMATLNGAKALGLSDEIGSLEVGKKADVAVVDARQIHVAPARQAYSMLVYALTGQDVEHVFVDGVQRVASGVVGGVDRVELIHAAHDHAARIIGPILG